MKTPGMRCEQCGGENLRRSKRQSFSELARMFLGMYPFRCVDCGARVWISVWLFSSLGLAKCPKCLRTDLLEWPEKYFRPTFWNRGLVTLGAHPYRCLACRYNFLSFRPRKGIEPATAKPVSNDDEESLRRAPDVESRESFNSASVAGS
jgi:DNA-directed RNA polymerase subunit RPC12/RpoP